MSRGDGEKEARRNIRYPVCPSGRNAGALDGARPNQYSYGTPVRSPVLEDGNVLLLLWDSRGHLRSTT